MCNFSARADFVRTPTFGAQSLDHIARANFPHMPTFCARELFILRNSACHGVTLVMWLKPSKTTLHAQVLRTCELFVLSNLPLRSFALRMRMPEVCAVGH